MFGNGNPVKIQFIALLIFVGLVCFTKLNPSLHAQVPDSVAMTLVEPASEMPVYALSKVRFGTDRDGKPLIEFDYSTSRPGKQILAEAVIRPGNLPDGQKMIFGAIRPGANTFRLRLDEERFAQLKQHGVEIVIVAELTSSQGGSGRQTTSYHYFKLSNAITFGGATSTCSMRPVAPPDAEAISRWLAGEMKRDAFESSIPEGFTKDISFRMPGMTIAVFVDGAWKVVEYLGDDAYDFIIFRTDPNSPQIETIRSRLVAFLASDLEKFRARVDTFKPSLKLMDSSSIIIPEDHELLSSRDLIIPGLPVKVKIKNALFEGIIVKKYSGNPHIRYDVVDSKQNKIRREKVFSTDDVLVAKAVVQQAKLPGSDKTFVLRLQESDASLGENEIPPLGSHAARMADLSERMMESGIKPTTEQIKPSAPATSPELPNTMNPTSASKSPVEASADSAPIKDSIAKLTPTQNPSRKVKRYPIGIAVPRGFQIVTNEDPLQPGLKVGCNWGSKWYPVTLLALFDDGAVRVRWDDYGPAWDVDLLREDLIINDKDLKTLKRKADSPDSSPRQWSDQSGKFKVLAWLDNIDQDSVKLRKPMGEEITVPIAKLSEKDQAIIRAKQRDAQKDN